MNTEQKEPTFSMYSGVKGLLITQSLALDYTASKVMMIVNNEFERILKEEAVAELRNDPDVYLNRLGKTENLSHDGWYLVNI
jgi:hypothetical protein